MAKSKSNKKSGNKPKKARISPIQCPEKMSLETWQQSLRRQAAENSIMAISGPVDGNSLFEVRSLESERTYYVEFFGEGSPYNRCECMDFRTNQLGTCKHIESVALYKNGRYAKKRLRKPLHTSVIVDYPANRAITLRLGEIAGDEIRKAGEEIFNADGTLSRLDCDPSQFIRKAKELDSGFKWEDDALDLLLAKREEKRRIKILGEKYADSDFTGLIKTKLHPYQVEGVKFAFAGGRTINADEMGLGKTVQAIATAELLKREGMIESVIIICPTSLKYQWLSEIRRFTDSSVMVVEGNMLKRRDQFEDKSFFYKICSFQGISNNVKGGYIPATDMIIYDELQRLKNWDTQMGRQLRKLSSEYVLALSGTPLENKLNDLYSVTQFVDQFRLGPLYKFTAQTTLHNDVGRVVGYQNLHSVAEMLSKTLIRRKKSQVKIQMPPRTDTNMFVSMTREQRTIHNEYKLQVATLINKWHRFKFLSETDRKRLLLFLSMMRMVCDSTFILDQKTRHDTKIDEIKEIINNLLESPEGKVVIFSQWERMLRILAQDLEEAQIDFCFLHGGVPSAKRKNLIDSFRDDPDCRIFLSTDAGATGLNLQVASLVINIDLPWNPAVLEQRISRIYRLGQENPVHIINMVAAETIEERMLSTLDFKSNLAAGILDGGEDAVFIENNKFGKIVDMVDDVISDDRKSADTDNIDADTENKTDTTADVEADATSDKVTSDTGKSASDTRKPDTDKSVDTDRTADTDKSTSSDRTADTDKSTSSDRTADTDKSTSSDRTANTDKSTSSGRTASPDKTSGTGRATDTGSGGSTTDRLPKSKDEVRDFVSGGMNFLGTLANMLREPDGAKNLADVLVKEDPETGKASLNIPVPDKSTVTNLFTAISTLLNAAK